MSTNVMRLHTMQLRLRLMITDRNKRWRQRKLPSMPSHEWKLYHCDDSNQEPRQDMNYECGTT